MDRRVRFLTSQLEKDSIPMRPLESALPFVTLSSDGNGHVGPALIDDLSNRLKDHEERLNQMNSGSESLIKRKLELEEAKHVLRETAVFFEQAEGRGENVRNSTDDANAPLLDDVESRAFNTGRQDESGYGTFDLE